VRKQIGRFLIWLLYRTQPDLFVFVVDEELRILTEQTVRNVEKLFKDRGGELKRDQAYKALHRLLPATPKRRIALAIEYAVGQMKGSLP